MFASKIAGAKQLPDVANSEPQVCNTTCAVPFHKNVLALDVSMCNCWFTFKIQQTNRSRLTTKSAVHGTAG